MNKLLYFSFFILFIFFLFPVMVWAGPRPEIIGVKYPKTVKRGDRFWIEVTVENNGDNFKGNGNVTVSIDYDSGVSAIDDISWDGDDYSRKYNHGQGKIWHKDVYQITTVDPMAEGNNKQWDGPWLFLAGEKHTLKVKITAPSSPGNIYFYVRSTFCDEDWKPIATNPSSSSYRDQQGWPVYRFEVTKDDRGPDPPRLVSPINGTCTEDKTVSLDWTEATDPSGIACYQLQVDNNSNFSSPEFVAFPSSSNNNTSSLADNLYYWRVQAKDNAENWGNWSSVWTFSVDTTAPSVPTLSSPADHSIIAQTKNTLDWSSSTDAGCGISHYDVEVYDWGFEPDISDTTTSSQYTILQNLTQKKWYWKIRAVDKAGNKSSWSDEWDFTFATTFTITVKTNVDAEVYLGGVNKGRADWLNIRTLKIENLPKGMYTVSVKEKGYREESETFNLIADVTKLFHLKYYPKFNMKDTFTVEQGQAVTISGEVQGPSTGDDPNGATVKLYIDGTSAPIKETHTTFGGNFEFMLSSSDTKSLSVGDHPLKVAIIEGSDWTDGSRMATLTVSPTYYIITVKTNVKGIKVFLNEEYKGETDWIVPYTCEIKDVPKGSSTVKVEAPKGYIPKSQSKEVIVADKNLSFEFNFEKLQITVAFSPPPPKTVDKEQIVDLTTVIHLNDNSTFWEVTVKLMEEDPLLLSDQEIAQKTLPVKGDETVTFSNIKLSDWMNGDDDVELYAYAEVKEVGISSKSSVSSVKVEDRPRLVVSPTTLDLGEAKMQGSLQIYNSGSGTLTWTLSENIAWLTVTPASGSSTGLNDKTTIQVTVDCTSLVSGDYNEPITVTSNGGNQAVSVKMSMPVPPSVKVNIQPAISEIAIGETTTVDVFIEEVSNFGGFEFKLLYNPSIIEITTSDVQMGDFLPQNKFYSLGPKINATGYLNELVYGVSLLGSISGQTGSGTLARITVKGIDAGKTSLEFKNILILNASSCINQLRVNATESTITVTDGQADITITTSIGSGTVIVDGETQNVPYQASWIKGSTHDLEITSPIDARAGERYVFTQWEDGSTSISRNVMALDAATYKANYKTQYYLNVKTESYDLTSIFGSDWYDTGSPANIGEAPEHVDNYKFVTWEVDGISTSGNPPTLIINESKTAVAKYDIVGVKGDVNCDAQISSNDALLALRIAVGLIIPSDYQKWAADMNGDGKVRSNDAMLILHQAAGLAAPDRQPVAVASRRITLMLQDAHGVAGESMTVPLRIDKIDGLAGGDIGIAYDSAVLRAIEVSSDDDVLLQRNITTTGMVYLTFASAERLKSKTIAEIQFDILADDVSPLTLQQVELYQSDALPVISRKIDGRFSSWAIAPKHSALLQNFPNPFNPETWFPYQLASASPVAISIYNAKGQLVRTIRLSKRNAGIYATKEKAAYWDGRDSLGEKVASGLYFYQLQAGSFSATRKMVILK